jgi:predicted nucleotidyltransferase
MIPAMKTNTLPNIESIANAIIAVSDPKLLVLFGSQAHGDANDNSDIDILIVADRPVGEKWNRGKELGRIRRSIPKSKMPLDLLLCTPEEVLKWKGTL